MKRGLPSWKLTAEEVVQFSPVLLQYFSTSPDAKDVPSTAGISIRERLGSAMSLYTLLVFSNAVTDGCPCSNRQ